MTAFEKLKKHYELEASLAELEERKAELMSRIPELKYEKREAEEAALAAGGGMRRFLQRLSGKEETDTEALRRKVSTASAALEQELRELAAVEQKLAERKEEQALLGEKPALPEGVTFEERKQMQRLEAALCAEQALHLLRKTRRELAAAQELARNPMITVNDGYRRNEYMAAAGEFADRCREKLIKIAQCGFELEIHPYLQQPMGYLVTAQRYAVLDRMNSAMKGIGEMEQALKELLLQLADES